MDKRANLNQLRAITSEPQISDISTAPYCREPAILSIAISKNRLSFGVREDSTIMPETPFVDDDTLKCPKPNVVHVSTNESVDVKSAVIPKTILLDEVIAYERIKLQLEYGLHFELFINFTSCYASYFFVRSEVESIEKKIMRLHQSYTGNISLTESVAKNLNKPTACCLPTSSSDLNENNLMGGIISHDPEEVSLLDKYLRP